MEKEEFIDVLNRERFLNTVTKIISAASKNKRNISFAINGEWGVGKTTVLNMLEEKLNNEYLVFRYNVWENDFYEEPLMAILSTIVEKLNEISYVENTFNGIKKEIINSVKSTFLELIGKISYAKFGFNIVDTAQKAYEKVSQIHNQNELDTSFDTNITIKSIKQKVRESLGRLSEEITIVVMVDELDRCMPEYAIKTLERLHHLFYNVPNLQMMIATDKKQLECTINKIFGETDVDKRIDRYLKKFIDFEVALDIGEFDSLLFNNRFKVYGANFEIPTSDEDYDSFIKNIFNDIDIRNRISLVDKANLIHNMIGESDKKYAYIYQCVGLLLVAIFAESKGFKLEIENHLYNPKATILHNNDKFKFIKDNLDDIYRIHYEKDQVTKKIIINADLFFGRLWYIVCSIYAKEKHSDLSYYRRTNQAQELNELVKYARAFTDMLKIII